MHLVEHNVLIGQLLATALICILNDDENEGIVESEALRKVVLAEVLGYEHSLTLEQFVDENLLGDLDPLQHGLHQHDALRQAPANDHLHPLQLDVQLPKSNFVFDKCLVVRLHQVFQELIFRRKVYIHEDVDDLVLLQ